MEGRELEALWWCSWGLLATGGLLLYIVARDVVTTCAVRNWLRVPGTVVRSEVIRSGPDPLEGSISTWEVDLEYVFHDGRRQRVGTDVFPNPLFFLTSREAEAMRREFLPGSRVFVHYNPSDPNECCLREATVSQLIEGASLPILLGVPLVVVGTSVLIGGIPFLERLLDVLARPLP